MATAVGIEPDVSKETPKIPKGIDPAYYALNLLRRRKLDDCVAVSAFYLKNPTGSPKAKTPTGGSSSSSAAEAPLDEQLWFIQTKAMVLQSWYDDAEIEDDGIDEVLMEGEQAVVSTAHRAKTSLRVSKTGHRTGATQSRIGGLGSAAGGRPISSRYGYARPGTLQSGAGGGGGGRGGTAIRPITGRFVRLGTASLQAVPGGPHINIQRLNLEKYAREKPMVSKLLCDYLLYVEHRPKLALELCTAALKVGSAGASSSTAAAPLLPLGATAARSDGARQGAGVPQVQVGITNVNDWWWKARLGKAYYQLGLLREAEKYFKASLFDPLPNAGGATQVVSYPSPRKNRFASYNTGVLMELGKVYHKMDQPLTAMELYTGALEENPVDHHVLLLLARLYDALHEPEKAFDSYALVLVIDSSNVEAVACIAAYFFYEKNQPELSVRLYRRLLQMGISSAEVWNNMGLCAFFSSQIDVALGCFERALTQCKENAQTADIWYNVGHVGVSVGDVVFAERAFKLAVAAEPTHAEALTNLAVLALHSKKKQEALLYNREQVAKDVVPESVYEAEAIEATTADAIRKKEREAKHFLQTAVMVAPELTEALYNSGLMAYQAGDVEDAYKQTMLALDTFPDHPESVALQARLRKELTAL